MRVAKSVSLVAAMLAGLLSAPLSLAESVEDKVVSFSTDDPEMNAAIAKARRGLPTFWSKFAKHEENEDGFSLKIVVTDGDKNEHFWCNEIEGDAAKATCAIANEPAAVQTVSFGQRIEIDPEHISDWMYRLDGKIKGGETIRVIIPKLSPEEAENVRALLADE